MLGANCDLTVIRAWPAGRDAEGRPRFSLADGPTVRGNLVERDARELVDGTWAVVRRLYALLPPGTEVTMADRLRDEAGNVYRIVSVTPRRGPYGTVRHLSVALARTGS